MVVIMKSTQAIKCKPSMLTLIKKDNGIVLFESYKADNLLKINNIIKELGITKIEYNQNIYFKRFLDALECETEYVGNKEKLWH